MNGPGDWEMDFQGAIGGLVESYVKILNTRMEYNASGGTLGGDAWLAAAGIPESKRYAYAQALFVFSKVEEVLLSDPTYIPIFYAARKGDLPIGMTPPAPAEETPDE